MGKKKIENTYVEKPTTFKDLWLGSWVQLSALVMTTRHAAMSATRRKANEDCTILEKRRVWGMASQSKTEKKVASEPNGTHHASLLGVGGSECVTCSCSGPGFLGVFGRF